MIAALPYYITPDHNSEYIELLFVNLGLWLKLYLQHQEELSPILHHQLCFSLAKPEAEFSVAMLTFAQQLLPRSAMLQQYWGDSHLKLWLVMEYSRACALLGRMGIARMPDLVDGRLAGEKLIKRHLRRAFQYHEFALRYGYYERRREVPSKKLQRELLLDAFLTHGVELSNHNKADENFQYHCNLFLTALKQYCLRPGALVFVDAKGNLHLTAPRKKLPNPKGFQRRNC